MESEYESTCVSAQKDFLELHTTLCNETVSRERLQQELDKRSRDFVTANSNFSGSAIANINAGNIDVTQALKALDDNGLKEKEQRSEVKLQQLASEIRQSQALVLESSGSLRVTYQTYVQVVCSSFV